MQNGWKSEMHPDGENSQLQNNVERLVALTENSKYVYREHRQWSEAGQEPAWTINIEFRRENVTYKQFMQVYHFLLTLSYVSIHVADYPILHFTISLR